MYIFYIHGKRVLIVLGLLSVSKGENISKYHGDQWSRTLFRSIIPSVESCGFVRQTQKA